MDQSLIRSWPGAARPPTATHGLPVSVDARHKAGHKRLVSGESLYLIGSELCVSYVCREHGQIDPELDEGPTPFPFLVRIEDDLVISYDGQPAVGLDLGIELAGCPASVA